jgi:hypothetical protein
MRRRDFLAGSTAGAVGLLAVRTVVGQEASNTAKLAFAFGYPLVLMDLTHRAMAGNTGPDQPAPLNRFFHFTKLPTEQFTALVCPVTDALHSSAWLNVKDEPMIISAPDPAGRLVIGSFFHAYHDVIGRLGSNASKGKPADYLITGPGWAGEVPKGVVHISSPTSLVWAPLWISVGGPDDVAAAAKLQAEFKVVPLKDWKGPQPTSTGMGGKLASLLNSFMKPKGPPGGFPGGMPPLGGPSGPMTITIGPDGKPVPPPPKLDADGNPIPPPPADSSAAPATVTETNAGVTTPPNPDGTPSTDGQMPSQDEGANAATGTSPNATLFTMEPNAFYTRMCQLMVENPPLEADAPLVSKMAKLGLQPAATIDLATANRANQTALLGGVRNAGQKVFTTKGGMKIITANRWETALNLSEFGTNYDRRAHAALMYFGASDPAEVLCPRTSKDASGRPLISQQKYTLTFAANQLPPAEKSWSLTAYRAPMMELGASPSGKHAITSRHELAKNPDGSITIYIQTTSPGPDKDPNWLPAPEGAFELMLRLYGPKPEVASLAWKPPAVTKV